MNINILAVIVSGFAAMGIGYIWYGPLFGKPWMKLVGLTQKDIEAKKPEMGKTYGMMFVSALVMAFILGIFQSFAGITSVVDGITVGFVAWLGFVATVKLSDVLFGGKALQLYCIEAGYYLATLLAMGAILSSWK